MRYTCSYLYLHGRYTFISSRISRLQQQQQQQQTRSLCAWNYNNNNNNISRDSKNKNNPCISLLLQRRHQSSSSIHSHKPNEWSYLSVPGEKPLLGLTIGQLIESTAKQFGGKESIYVSHQNIRKTFEQIHKESDELGEGFLQLGLERGDRVGIWGPNSYEWYLTHMAIAKSGLVLVNLNPAYQGPEIHYAINRVGIKCLVIATPFKSQNYYNILTSIIPTMIHSDPGKIQDKATPSLKTVITMDTNPLKGTISFEQIKFNGTKGNDLLSRAIPSIQFDDVFNVQFTSGTTGKPKGVMLTHHNLVNNSFLIAKRLGYTIKDKLCLAVPLFHCYGQVGAMLTALHNGSGIVLPSPGFDPLKTIQSIHTEKCTSLYGTPTMHVDMTNLSELDQYDLSSLRYAVTAGATCPEDIFHQLKSKFKLDSVVSYYGLTETSPVFFQTILSDSDELKNTTVGYPQEHTEVKIVDSNGLIVPIGVEGEVCVRGYMTMLGYWDEPKKTLEVLKPSNWFHTGDNFVMTKTGHGKVVGRLKDMIIRGGENIYPKEIEEYLHSHPKILEAHVFGVSDKRMGEEVGVWIRLKEGDTMNEQELKNYCKGQISHFKIPKYISFRSDFPKTASGKIQKFQMREIVEKELLLKNSTTSSSSS